MKLSPVMTKFVLHWGEMGTRWGINRTVAQIHALLYISAGPLNAEQIATTLNVARSNVSNSLRELLSWGIVRVVHVMGDRRDHYESMRDPWEMFRIVMDERKKREVDPTVMLLRDCAAEAERAGPREEHARQRLAELLDFFQTMSLWYEQVRRMPTPMLKRFVKMGDTIGRLIGGEAQRPK